MHDPEATRDPAGLALPGDPPVATDAFTEASSTEQRRAALRHASRAVLTAGRGLIADHGVGFDPNAEDQLRPWWARAKLLALTEVVVTVEGFETGLDALRALADAVTDRVAQLGIAPRP